MNRPELSVTPAISHGGRYTQIGKDVLAELRHGRALTSVQLARLTGHRRADVRSALLGLEVVGLVRLADPTRGRQTWQAT